MRVSPSFEQEVDSGSVCKLKKSLYGLKQSLRTSFHKFSMTLNRLEYKQGQFDHIVFIKHNENGKRTILIVYVDDIIMIKE